MKCSILHHYIVLPGLLLHCLDCLCVNLILTLFQDRFSSSDDTLETLDVSMFMADKTTLVLLFLALFPKVRANQPLKEVKPILFWSC